MYSLPSASIDAGAFAAGDEAGSAADAAEGADGRIDAAGDGMARAIEERFRAGRVHSGTDVGRFISISKRLAFRLLNSLCLRLR